MHSGDIVDQFDGKVKRKAGLWSLVFGLWSLVFGLWSLALRLEDLSWWTKNRGSTPKSKDKPKSSVLHTGCSNPVAYSG